VEEGFEGRLSESGTDEAKVIAEAEPSATRDDGEDIDAQVPVKGGTGLAVREPSAVASFQTH
jgi:hypothetical protein